MRLLKLSCRLIGSSCRRIELTVVTSESRRVLPASVRVTIGAYRLLKFFAVFAETSNTGGRMVCSSHRIGSLAVVTASIALGCAQNTNLAGANDASKGKANGKDKNSGANSDINDAGGRPGRNTASGDASGGVLEEILPDGRVKLTFVGESQTKVSPVDIVIALDTSGSMNEERAALEQNLNGFLAQIAKTAGNVDYMAWILARPFNLTSNTDSKVEVVPTKVSSNDALMKLRDFVTGAGGSSRPLRDQSQKQFIIISDDNARRVVANDFIGLVASTPKLTGKTSVSGIIGLKPGAVQTGCNIAAVGTEYQILAAAPTTRGIILDLCSNNWSQLLGVLAQKIATDTLRRDFPLSTAAKPAIGLNVSIAGIEIAAESYTYDTKTRTLSISPDKAPKSGQELVVIYTPN